MRRNERDSFLFADGCDDIMIDIDPVSDICRDTLTAAFNLNVTVSNSDGTGVGTWSGPGITDPALGTFDPQLANLGVNTIVYDFTENDCDFSGSIEITIIEEPIAFFSATNVICISDSSVVTTTTYSSLIGYVLFRDGNHEMKY